MKERTSVAPMAQGRHSRRLIGGMLALFLVALVGINIVAAAESLSWVHVERASVVLAVAFVLGGASYLCGWMVERLHALAKPR